MTKVLIITHLLNTIPVIKGHKSHVFLTVIIHLSINIIIILYSALQAMTTSIVNELFAINLILCINKNHLLLQFVNYL